MIKFYGERYIFFQLISINIKVSWRMFFEAMEAIARVFERHRRTSGVLSYSPGIFFLGASATKILTPVVTGATRGI